MVTHVVFINLSPRAFRFKYSGISITKCGRSLLLLFDVLVLALLICTVARDIYEFLACDSFK